MIQCFPDEYDPNGVCITCQISKPGFCRLPCIRLKITDTSLFRLGLLAHIQATETYLSLMLPLVSADDFLWTRRWLGKGVKDINTWEAPKMKQVNLIQHDGDDPITVTVKKFVPIEGDAVSYHWQTLEGTRSLFCAPYALANVQEASRELKRHIKQSATSYIERFITGKSQILSATYAAIQRAINQNQVYHLPSCLLMQV